jgi:hypothetical protein
MHGRVTHAMICSPEIYMYTTSSNLENDAHIYFSDLFHMYGHHEVVYNTILHDMSCYDMNHPCHTQRHCPVPWLSMKVMYCWEVCPLNDVSSMTLQNHKMFNSIGSRIIRGSIAYSYWMAWGKYQLCCPPRQKLGTHTHTHTHTHPPTHTHTHAHTCARTHTHTHTLRPSGNSFCRGGQQSWYFAKWPFNNCFILPIQTSDVKVYYSKKLSIWPSLNHCLLRWHHVT